MWGNLEQSIEGNTGGGFMNESASTIGTVAKTQSQRRVKNVVPVFIKHLLTCNGDILSFSKTFLVYEVVFIARILDIEMTATKNTYTLQDDTGTIVGFQWLEAGRNEKHPPMQAGAHCKVFGKLRENHGKKHILIQLIKPLSSLNELVCLHLEIMEMFIKYTPEKMEAFAPQPINASSKMSTENADNGESTVGLSKEQAIVFKLIEMENESENGIERRALKSRVPKNMLSQVDSIIDFLISEGHIYSTLSDNYFKST